MGPGETNPSLKSSNVHRGWRRANIWREVGKTPFYNFESGAFNHSATLPLLADAIILALSGPTSFARSGVVASLFAVCFYLRFTKTSLSHLRTSVGEAS